MASPPEWISTLANSIAACLEPIEPLPPLGCHFHHCDESWEISIFPSKTEIVGGPNDGRQVSPRFRVDILAVTRHFSEIFAMTWQTKMVDEDDQLGSHFAVDGIHSGEVVSVRILKAAPKCFEPGRKALINDGHWVETW